MECLICQSKLSIKAKFLCSECNNKKHSLLCKECNSITNVSGHYFKDKKDSYYLCRKCVGKGERNNNYGRKWSIEQKEKASKNVKSKVDEKYRLNCSKGMKGKSVSEETKLKRKETINLKYINGYKKPPMSDEAKRKIGIKSSEKFTPEFKEKWRKTLEKSGKWIPLDKTNDYMFYKKNSNWKTQVITSITPGNEKLKDGNLKSKGNNTANSLVRDHMFSRRNGFEKGVFPEIIRHPANCQIITHSENIKKAKNKDDSIISYEELIKRILDWSLYYSEQILCVDLINQYKNGKRYIKSNYY